MTCHVFGAVSSPAVANFAMKKLAAECDDQDIADTMQEPLGTVKSRIHFARKILTSKLDR